MKKKLLIFVMFMLCVLALTACGKSKVNLKDCMIEQRENLFYASDNLYAVTLSSGMREENYALDGKVNPMVEFGILTISRLNGDTMANGKYNYIVRINGEDTSGEMEANPTDNNFSADLGVKLKNDDQVSVQINFTGYSFNKEMENVSKDFAVDSKAALKIAQEKLSKSLKEISGNCKIEAIMKIVKDYSSSDVKVYYWYVGVVSTNGDTLGILISALDGSIISSKL